MQNKELVFKTIWEEFEHSHIPVHSFLASQGDMTLIEGYREPYDDSRLHRMFSVTKSFTSLAVGYLLEDGLISLDDSITCYFPEFCPPCGFHPWQKAMTIRHMLLMQTCYSSTTFKEHPDKNWVESFFTAAPTHRSGQIFLYDTSSSHTLLALVAKLTGKGLLDYLREKFLNQIGFSKDAYIMPDPFGSEMGGSGLMARPADLLKVGNYLLKVLKSGNGIFSDYLREAVSFQVPTVFSGQTLDEQLGYGYQFWMVRNGFAMYGMGGQYLLCYPEADLVCVVTADTQNIKGGNQWLLDVVTKAMEPLLTEKKLEQKFHFPLVWNAKYHFMENCKNFSFAELSFDSAGGTLILHGEQHVFTIPFSFDHPVTGILEKYRQQIATKALWADSATLYLPVQITDECVGSIHIALKLSGQEVTVWMKKIEETYFDEFQGFLEGRTF